MHPSARLGLLAFATALPLAAQTLHSPAATSACSAASLSGAAGQAASLRSQLRREAVPADNPSISPRLASLLAQFKDALAATAVTAFRCASATTSADQLQATLADALHVNRSAAAETAFEKRHHQNIGTFGADLAVQVFQLFGAPRIFEVDLRYGIECGDDNLLLVFEAPAEALPGAQDQWRETLRWDAHQYTSVSDALGDFVLLTPLTGSYQHPVWHYLVAHGSPGCGQTPRPSRFSLDLLTPAADPASPTVAWHFGDIYSQGNTIPRLATTEDSIEFRIVPAAPDPAVAGAPRPSAATATKFPLPPEQVYRFHLSSAGQVVPSPPGPSSASASAPGR